jgi:hypothetical protein
MFSIDTSDGDRPAQIGAVVSIFRIDTSDGDSPAPPQT